MREFRKDIEGLRAIAVVAVVLYHAEVPGFSGGYVGVDVFFVISGFLITRQLLHDDDESALARIRRFYARRVRRIVPAATLTIVGTLILAAILQPPLLQRASRLDAVAAMFFFANVRFSQDAVDYFRQGDAPSLFQHFWSLSLEEQFYVVWPALLVGVSLVAIGRRRVARGTLIAIVLAASLVASVVITKQNPLSAFYLLPVRAWELAAGALLAIWGATVFTSSRLAVLARAVGLVLIAVSIVVFGDVQYFPGYAALVPVGGTVLVVAAGMASGDVSNRGVLAIAPMQLLGRYSYSLYLWHWPALMLAGMQWPVVLHSWPRATMVMAAAALPAAVASYHLVEHPFRVEFNRRPTRDSLWAGGAILGAGAVFLAGYGAFAMTELDSGRRAPSLAEGRLVATPFVPSNVRPTLLRAHNGGNEAARSCKTSLNPCVLGDPASAQTVVVYGDSHALHWLAAFDEAGKRNHWRVLALVRPGCSSYFHPPAVKFQRCDGFRRNANAAIAAADPSLIVLSNSSVLAFQDMGMRIGEGIRAAVRGLPPHVPVAVLGETPRADRDVPACLSEHLESTSECEPRPESGDVINRMLRRALADTQATFVDADSLMCERGRCPTVVGDVLVYRDDDHVTYEFARTRASALAALLSPLVQR